MHRGKQQLAAYMFRNITETQWRTVEPAYEKIEDDEAQATFKEAFNKKFILDHVWVQKLVEFEPLANGNMTVLQYKIKFTQLSFALELVAIDAQRIRRVVRGIHPAIRKDVTCNDLPTFEENLKNAFWSKDYSSQIKAPEAKTKKGHFGPKRPTPALQHMQQQPKRQKNPIRYQQLQYFNFCGKDNHLAQIVVTRLVFQMWLQQPFNRGLPEKHSCTADSSFETAYSCTAIAEVVANTTQAAAAVPAQTPTATTTQAPATEEA